jgi:hypothetical protein
MISFHLTNAFLWDIDVFPWLMIPASLVFLPPEWPRRFAHAPLVHEAVDETVPITPARRALLAVLAIHVAVQLILPWRHCLYPGDTNWTEEAYRFSWRMMLRTKESTIRFVAVTPSSTWEIDPADDLRDYQYSSVGERPDVTQIYAAYLGRTASERIGEPVAIHAIVDVGLNGRPPALLIDPAVDLAHVPDTVLPKPWILPPTGPRQDEAREQQRRLIAALGHP